MDEPVQWEWRYVFSSIRFILLPQGRMRFDEQVASSFSRPINLTFIFLLSPLPSPSFHQILGFSSTGQPVIPTSHTSAAMEEGADSRAFVPASGTSARREKLSWDEICKRSAKVLSFIGECRARPDSTSGGCWGSMRTRGRGRLQSSSES